MTSETDQPSAAGSWVQSPQSAEEISRTTRDRDDVRQRLESWFAEILGQGSDPTVGDLSSPGTTGMSSDTYLFNLRWSSESGPTDLDCVARLAPDTDEVPVFASYDLAAQARVMQLVGSATAAPVPDVRWQAHDDSPLGAPMIVMGRVDGQVPPDVLPYTFGDNWVFDAMPQQRSFLERSALAALAQIHTIDPDRTDLGFLGWERDAKHTALETHLAWWVDYNRWVTAEGPSPLLEEGFAWLSANVPTTVEAKLAWGDARIGNMIFDEGFEVAAVLDWEMASVAPPEVDLGWFIYLHMFFQDLAEDLGAEGLPSMLVADRVAETYAELSGHEPVDLEWFIAYAAMRHGSIMRRVTERSVHFGEAERTDDPDEMIIHRATLRAMIDGSYHRFTGA